MVLAGRGLDEHHNTFDFATFLALTYFFPESDCFGTSEHANWRQAVEIAAGQDAELHIHSAEPTLIALEYDATRSRKKGWSAISALPYFAYASFFIYVFWGMRQLTSVHSRTGVAFTALVEIIVSTITSLSVCALVGFRVTLVPWELLPVVIVFVGAENMFNLVDAVGKTPVTLSVKQRVAEGLSRAGTSNTLKVVSYNSILGVIAVFSTGAIRQFCIFAIVVLVAHWFLAHTFFMAVLSIDIQRLELDELLRQDVGLAPALTRKDSENTPFKSNPSFMWKLGVLIRKLLSGRAKKNLSLVLLLAITATLYYATMPPENVQGIKSNIQASPRGALTRSNMPAPTNTATLQPDSQIWKLLNPTGVPLHLRVEAPSILTFKPNVDNAEPSTEHQKTHNKSLARTLRSVLWLIKIMVLPIAATTFVLWCLLLYLLKDAELLDAQKNRADAEPTRNLKDHVTALEKRASFSTLPRAFPSDVELIATSSDGRTVISVGLHNEVAIWKTMLGEHIPIDTSDFLLQAGTSLATSTLTAVAMDRKGHFCAVGTGGGTIAVWNIQNKTLRAYPQINLPNSSAGIRDLRFVSGSSAPTSPSDIAPMSLSSAPLFILATYENGAAVKYTVGAQLTPIYLHPSSRNPVLYTKVVDIIPNDRVALAFCLEDGSVEIMEVGNDNSPLMKENLSIQPGHPTDLATKVHVCQPIIGEETCVVIAAVTESGVISLWDGQTGECIRILDESFGRITQLRISPVRTETCHFCGNLPPDSVCLSFSVDTVVRFYKVYRNDETRRCSCVQTTSPGKKQSQGTMGRNSRSNSSASNPSSPLLRSRGPSASDVSPFPVSGHGVHSKRASEKADASRRLSEGLIFPADIEDRRLFIGTQDLNRSSVSFWHRSYVAWIADTTCERGSWDIYDGKIVGVRRRSRLAGQSNGTFKASGTTQRGLSSSILSRWEIWTFDPCTSHLQSSPLSLLVIETGDSSSPSSSTSSSPSSGASVPRLPFTRVTPFIVARYISLAGFGNTLGVFKFSC
ncbi:sterol regulatory element binding protein cleavage-activating protein [Moniliophthora roreri]|nr:sterol regulatory element binding protein cleavage-activating protein [Moniliophthora roreri]